MIFLLFKLLNLIPVSVSMLSVSKSIAKNRWYWSPILLFLFFDNLHNIFVIDLMINTHSLRVMFRWSALLLLTEHVSSPIYGEKKKRFFLTQTSAYRKLSTRLLWIAWHTCSIVAPFRTISPSSKSGYSPLLFVYTRIRFNFFQIDSTRKSMLRSCSQDTTTVSGSRASLSTSSMVIWSILL